MAIPRIASYFNRRRRVHSAEASSQVFIELEDSGFDVFNIVQNGYLEELQLLSGSKLLQQRNSKGMTLIHAAVASKYLEVLRFLLKEDGIPISAQDSNGDTALHTSIETGNIAAMVLLLDYGADETIKNRQGKPPLHLLVQRSDRFEQLAEFLQHLININVKDANNASIFHCIVECDNLKALELILPSVEAQTNLLNYCFCSQNTNGTTAIHLAAMKGAYKVLDFMLC